MDTIKLQKYMAECGIASRRKCEEIISTGKVKVNGHIATIGDRINPKKDIVVYKGQKVLKENESYVYFALNKPRGYLSSASDDRGRKTVVDLIDTNHRIYPVGRLDLQSEGLILLTDDGDFSNHVTHPSHNFDKTYQVTVSPIPSDETIDKLMSGVEIDGRMTKKCRVDFLKIREDRATLEFVIHEGRNRQIRKMCEAVDLKVLRLKRTAIGNLKVDDIKLGEYRELTEKEITFFKKR